jgi:hypothetical protein
MGQNDPHRRAFIFYEKFHPSAKAFFILNPITGVYRGRSAPKNFEEEKGWGHA